MENKIAIIGSEHVSGKDIFDALHERGLAYSDGAILIVAAEGPQAIAFKPEPIVIEQVPAHARCGPFKEPKNFINGKKLPSKKRRRNGHKTKI